MTTATLKITEPSVHHSFIYRKVDDVLLLTVVDSGKSSLLRLTLHNLHLLDHLGRKVLCRQLRVIKEECLAIDSDLCDGLSVRCDRSIGVHLHTWKFLEEILEHIVIRCLERRCIILDGILLYDDRVTDSRNAGSIENLDILLHPDSSEIDGLFQSQFLLMSLISHDFCFKDICTFLHFCDCCRSFVVSQHILQCFLFTLYSKGCSCETYWLACLVIYKFETYCKRVLRISRKSCKQKQADDGNSGKDTGNLHNKSIMLLGKIHGETL